MKKVICPQCNKRCYTVDNCIHYALGTSKTFGKPIRIYECPHQPSVYHLTSK